MKTLSRRNLLKTIGSLTIASTVPIPALSMAGMWGQLFGGLGREVSPITPNDQFYITSYRSPPNIRVHDWSLTIKGLVKSPMTLTYPNLVALPRVSTIVTMECIGNGVGGENIGTANWEGVSLKSLLDQVGVDSQAYDVVLRAADGYADGFTVERAMEGDILIAYRMNGVPLPPGHGYPVRIIAPGVYGMKNVQWLTEIELVSKDHQGFFQQQGWSDDATVHTRSWITDPQEGDELPNQSMTMKGFAFAGTRGIRSVDISVDGGETWRSANIKPPLSPYAWVFWNYSWVGPKPGYYRLLVRATDGKGGLQSALPHKPFPNGGTGLQKITVTIRE